MQRAGIPALEGLVLAYDTKRWILLRKVNWGVERRWGAVRGGKGRGGRGTIEKEREEGCSFIRAR